MTVEIRWSKKAERKFQSNTEYLSVNWGEKAAISFVKKTINLLRFLADFPLVELFRKKHREC